jgi:hypothetical protein
MAHPLFRYSELKNLLKHMLMEYRVWPLGQWDGSPGVILRHDCDLEIRPAHDLSLIEEEIGIRSTFFILTTGLTYNPLALPNRRLLRNMAERGFEIGLHFDPTVYPEADLDELQKWTRREADLLADVTGRPVRSLSLHNPTALGRYPMFEGFHNAYDERIFGPDRYLSDSIRVFRHDVYEFLERARETHVQLLLHPFLYSPEGEGYAFLGGRYIHRHCDQIDDMLGSVNKTYRAEVPLGLLRHAFQRLEEENRHKTSDKDPDPASRR